MMAQMIRNITRFQKNDMINRKMKKLKNKEAKNNIARTVKSFWK